MKEAVLWAEQWLSFPAAQFRDGDVEEDRRQSRGHSDGPHEVPQGVRPPHRGGPPQTDSGLEKGHVRKLAEVPLEAERHGRNRIETDSRSRKDAPPPHAGSGE